MELSCPICSGTGLVHGVSCSDCGGDGSIDLEDTKSLDQGMHKKLVGLIAAEILTALSDLSDKVDDVEDKCDDILEKLDE